jgi:hypothetical protein
MRRSALLLVLALTGCMGDGTTTTTVAASEPPRSADFGIAMRFVNGNAAQAREGWARSHITTAARFLSIVGTDAESTSITVPTPEVGNRVVVTITQEGLLDDSVRAVRYRLLMRRRPDGTWRIFSVERTQRCWAGRGHEQFSAAPCV